MGVMDQLTGLKNQQQQIELLRRLRATLRPSKQDDNSNKIKWLQTNPAAPPTASFL